MVIVMKDTAEESDIAAVSEQLRLKGFDVHRVDGVNRTVLGAIGDKRDIDPREFEILPGVHEVFRISEPYKLASRTFHPENSIIKIGDIRFGDNEVVMIAGPCAIENISGSLKLLLSTSPSP